jgi:serine/threonine protein kinase
MAMPMFRLANLADYMSKFSSKQEKVETAHGVLCAVSHLHDNSILHRDIKSDNIVLEYSSDGDPSTIRPVLIDFSLAKVLEPDRLIRVAVAAIMLFRMMDQRILLPLDRQLIEPQRWWIKKSMAYHRTCGASASFCSNSCKGNFWTQQRTRVRPHTSTHVLHPMFVD